MSFSAAITWTRVGAAVLDAARAPLLAPNAARRRAHLLPQEVPGDREAPLHERTGSAVAEGPTVAVDELEGVGHELGRVDRGARASDLHAHQRQQRRPGNLEEASERLRRFVGAELLEEARRLAIERRVAEHAKPRSRPRRQPRLGLGSGQRPQLGSRLGRLRCPRGGRALHSSLSRPVSPGQTLPARLSRFPTRPSSHDTRRRGRVGHSWHRRALREGAILGAVAHECRSRRRLTAQGAEG
jgi:hypothetical protein